MKHEVKFYIEYSCIGYDRPYSETKEMPAGDAATVQAWHEQLRARTTDEAVTNYKTFQISVVTLDDGEVLRGNRKNVSNETYFGSVKPIPDTAYPTKISDVKPSQINASDDWKLKNAQRAHAIYQRELKNGNTHILVSPHAPRTFIDRKTKIRVFDAVTGDQVWPLAAPAPKQKNAPKP